MRMSHQVNENDEETCETSKSLYTLKIVILIQSLLINFIGVTEYRPALLDTLLDHYPLVDSNGKVIETNRTTIQQEIDTFLFAVSRQFFDLTGKFN